MSDNDGNDITKLIIFTLGLATIGLFAYLIFKEIKGYQLGGYGIQQPTTLSLAEDNYFQMDRRLHQLEMDRMAMDRMAMDRNVKNVRTLQPVVGIDQKQVGQSSDYLQNSDAPQIPRKVVSMNSSSPSSHSSLSSKPTLNVPNIQGLSKGDQDKVRRLFFGML